jgi:RimJ/RimL family protein N-acetyltransferase
MIDFGYGIQLDTLDNAPMAREWRNQKAIYQNCRQVGLITEANQKKWLETGDVQNMFSIMAIGPYPLIGDPDNKCVIPVGVAGLTSIHFTHRTAEISLYIAEEYHGKVATGTAGAIIKTLAAYAFEDLNLNRIFGETFWTNTVEILNLQELGFITEGTLRQTYYKDGRYIDSVIQSLLRSDYDKLKDGWK